MAEAGCADAVRTALLVGDSKHGARFASDEVGGAAGPPCCNAAHATGRGGQRGGLRDATRFSDRKGAGRGGFTWRAGQVVLGLMHLAPGADHPRHGHDAEEVLAGALPLLVV
jgi:hypothetical protein